MRWPPRSVLFSSKSLLRDQSADFLLTYYFINTFSYYYFVLFIYHVYLFMHWITFTCSVCDYFLAELCMCVPHYCSLVKNEVIVGIYVQVDV